MKNFCFVHILLFILMMLVYQCSHAQDVFISAKGDTLMGDVKQIGFGPEKKVQVATADKKKIIFSIFQTRQFTDNGADFQPVKGSKGYVFMKILKPGYLSLLAFQPDNQTNYDGLLLLKRDGSSIEVPGLTFKKVMLRFLSDCPDVTARIESGDLNRKTLDKIVDEYNMCIGNNTAEQTKAAAITNQQNKKINNWDLLEEKVKGKPDFEGKSDALEMISDIKGKIKRSEKIPNFLLDGLKNSLANADLNAELQNALNEVKQ